MLVVLVVVVAVVAAALGAGVGVLLARRGSHLDARALSVLRLGVLVVDCHARVVSANASARTMGLVRGDQLALNELRALSAAARASGATREAEVSLLRGWLPREPLAVVARATPVGTLGHVAVEVEDVTGARRVADMRRDFVANVSHELKTPVGALTLLAEALAGAGDDPQAVVYFAGRMQHEANRLARLVQELIELSRLEAADSAPAAADVALDAVIADAVDRTKLAAAGRDITVSVNAAPDLLVLGNSQQLITAIVNLLDNAVQYSAEHTEVRVRARRSGDAVEVAVDDQGIGIDESDLERVFERFYRADPARSRATGGTGLGLAIVKHVAANHGGTVEVRSRLGRGSTFTLVLPAASAALGSGAPLAGAAP